MDHRPETPEAISAAPMKKGSSSHTRSSGCACSLAAITIVVTMVAYGIMATIRHAHFWQKRQIAQVTARHHMRSGIL